MDLYLATRSDAPHLLKIGRSSNAHSRCRQLQTGHCFRIHVLAIFRRMGAREAPVHRALKEYRLNDSEWFDVDMLTAIEAIQEAHPQQTRKSVYNLEQIAWKNRQKEKHFKIHPISSAQRTRITMFVFAAICP